MHRSTIDRARARLTPVITRRVSGDQTGRRAGTRRYGRRRERRRRSQQRDGTNDDAPLVLSMMTTPTDAWTSHISPSGLLPPLSIFFLPSAALFWATTGTPRHGTPPGASFSNNKDIYVDQVQIGKKILLCNRWIDRCSGRARRLPCMPMHARTPAGDTRPSLPAGLPQRMRPQPYHRLVGRRLTRLAPPAKQPPPARRLFRAVRCVPRCCTALTVLYLPRASAPTSRAPVTVTDRARARPSVSRSGP